MKRGNADIQQFAWLAAVVPSKGANIHRPAIGDLSREPGTPSRTDDTLDGALASGSTVGSVKNAKQTSAGLITASSIPVSTAGR